MSRGVPAAPSVTVLTWCGLVASPVVVFLAMQGALDHVFGLSGFLLGLLLVLAGVAPAAVLLRRPPAALASMLASLAVVSVFHAPWTVATDDLHNLRIVQIIVVDLAVGYLALHRPRRVSLPAAAASLGVQLVLVLLNPIGSNVLPQVSIGLVLGMATCWLVGQSVRQRRVYAAADRARVADRAVQEERLRIARELHDMMAHSLGVIAIQAGMGTRVIDTQPAEARGALRTIEHSSRETLAGLRRMLGVLRHADAGPDDGSLAPAPGLALLDQLVGSAAAAGVTMEVSWHGEPPALPPDVDLAAYRVVQEAVTNVVRHAGTDRCQVRLDADGGTLRIEVTDDGLGGLGPLPGGGYGIAGMRERVALLDGEFTAGPRPEGGFRVLARLPVPAPVG
jgi:signal transduction histidine kinase